MPSISMLIVAVCAVIACLLLPSYAAPSARLIQTSEAFPSKSSPDRLVPSSVPLQSAPEPGKTTSYSAHTACHSPVTGKAQTTYARNISGIPLISLDPSTRFQTIWGFGGAITDAVAHVHAHPETPRANARTCQFSPFAGVLAAQRYAAAAGA
jgi:hypothetical protein